NLLRDAGALAAEQKDVVVFKSMFEIAALRPRREQYEPQRALAPPLFERGPGQVAHERHLVEIVHAGAAERAVAGGKARRLDDVRLEAEAGGEAKNRSGVLGDVGLIKREAHGVR